MSLDDTLRDQLLVLEDTQTVVVADVPETNGAVQGGREEESALGPSEIHDMRLSNHAAKNSLLCGR